MVSLLLRGWRGCRVRLRPSGSVAVRGHLLAQGPRSPRAALTGRVRSNDARLKLQANSTIRSFRRKE